MSLGCRSTARRLAAFAAGDLARQTRSGVRRHLQACPTCRADYARWLRAHRALASLADERGPEEFFAGLQRDIIGVVGGQAPAMRRRPGRARRFAMSSMAAAMLFAVGLRLGVGSATGGGEEPLSKPLADPVSYRPSDDGPVRPMRADLLERGLVDRVLPVVDQLSEEAYQQLLADLERERALRALASSKKR